MRLKRRFAMFDIDDTMFRGDSLFKLYFWGLRVRPLCALLIPLMPFAGLLYALKLLPRESLKRIYYSPLYAMDEEDYETFFSERLEKNFYPDSLQALTDAKEQGYYVLMATASPYAYMRMFEKRGLADKVIGTQVAMKNGRYTSRVTGKNCAGEEKARRIRAFLESEGLEVDYDASIGYSDSDKDIPMLRMVKTARRVLPGGKMIEFVGR